jgi:hypothetical protein
MPETISACFDNVDAALQALAELRRKGFSGSALTLMSAEPMHAALEASDSKAKTRIGPFSVAGGLIGAAAALALTIWTARRVGLVVGGMPIVTPWAFGIIVFEMIALGAILASVGRTIYEGGLMRPSKLRRYDDLLDNGRVVLAIEFGDNDDRDRAKAVLARTGASVLDQN